MVMVVKLTMFLKLYPTEQQKEALLRTMEQFNTACNYVSEVAFKEQTASQVKLHHLTYYAIREKFGLSAQMAVRVIGKVAETYKVDRKRLHTFKPHGAIVYDQRILTFKFPDKVSILTIEGRQVIPFVFKNYRQLDIRRVCGQADLVYRNGDFYLAVCVDIPELPVDEPTEWLGVDLGIVNIATDSDGESYSGAQVNGLRKRYTKLRSKLQKKATEKRKSGQRPKSIIRLLKKRSKKEHRFVTNVNHVIAKRLVAKAKGTGRGIALENLTNIRDRITVRKAQRRTQHSWAFRQLRTFIEYKAKLAGVPATLVDPRNTSRTCSVCGCVDKRNRPDQAHFCCTSCGFAGPADVIAAVNIGRRAAVNRPNVATA
jgi:IS605 OrfB family transposase